MNEEEKFLLSENVKLIVNNAYRIETEALQIAKEYKAERDVLQKENERLRDGILKAVQKLEASDLIDLVHVMINDRYGAAKVCIQKALRELESLQSDP